MPGFRASLNIYGKTYPHRDSNPVLSRRLRIATPTTLGLPPLIQELTSILFVGQAINRGNLFVTNNRKTGKMEYIPFKTCIISLGVWPSLRAYVQHTHISSANIMFLGTRLQMQLHTDVQPSYVKTAAKYGRNACNWHAHILEALGDLAVPWRIVSIWGYRHSYMKHWVILLYLGE